jgi:hypothetical protein
MLKFAPIVLVRIVRKTWTPLPDHCLSFPLG